MKPEYSIQTINGDWPKGHTSLVPVPYFSSSIYNLASLTIRKELNQPASAMAPQGFFNTTRRFYNRQRA